MTLWVIFDMFVGNSTIADPVYIKTGRFATLQKTIN